MKAVKRVTAHGFAFVTGTRRRLLAFCIALLALGAGATVSVAQTVGASLNPFGKPSVGSPIPGASITAV